jgi:hypothetical protein
MGKICLHLQKRFIAQMQMGNCKHIQPVGNSDRFKFDDWSICNYLIKNNLESSDILVFINSASGVAQNGSNIKEDQRIAEISTGE